MPLISFSYLTTTNRLGKLTASSAMTLAAR